MKWRLKRRRFRIPKLPTSKRYCRSCKKPTTFKLNRNIFHSCCVECGGMSCRKLKDEERDKMKNEFCSRCRKWKNHIWIENKEMRIRVLKCSKCKKNKRVEELK